jgi:hypothetical protein
MVVRGGRLSLTKLCLLVPTCGASALFVGVRKGGKTVVEMPKGFGGTK